MKYHYGQIPIHVFTAMVQSESILESILEMSHSGAVTKMIASDGEIISIYLPETLYKREDVMAYITEYSSQQKEAT